LLIVIAIAISSASAMASTSKASTRPTIRRESFHKTVTRRVGYDFLVQLPRGYDAQSQTRYPLILFLHGSGECGHDLAHVARSALPKIASTQPAFPFILISPQSPSELDWWQTDSLDALLDHVLANYRVDPNRVYLTGISMGAYGVWDWAVHRPEAFAAIAPMAGEGNDDLAPRLRHVPVWAFHGGKDKAVSLAEEQRMVDAVNRAGGSAKLTIYPDRGHDVWDIAYRDPALFNWLLKQHRPADAQAK
jgi:predicted peptidase